MATESNRTAEAVALLKKHSMEANDGREFDYSNSWILGAMHDFAFPLEERISKLESDKETYFNDAKRYSDKLEAAKTLIKQQHESNQQSQSTIKQLQEEISEKNREVEALRKVQKDDKRIHANEIKELVETLSKVRQEAFCLHGDTIRLVDSVLSKLNSKNQGGG